VILRLRFELVKKEVVPVEGKREISRAKKKMQKKNTHVLR